MAFFPEQPIDTKAQDQAIYLFDIIKKKRIAGPKKEHIGTWSKSLNQLNKQYGSEVVDQVLEWYSSHIGEEFIPEAYTGMAFRSKFENILKAMDKDTDLINEMIGPEDTILARNLLNSYSFPIEIASNLSTIIYRSRRNWNKFWEDVIDKWYGKCSPRDSQFIDDRIIRQEGPTFIENWILFLQKKYGHLQSYTGLVFPYLVFRPDSRQFRESFWRRWSQEWTGDALAFESLLDQLLGKKDASKEKTS